MTDNLIYNRYASDYSETQALMEVLRQTERHLEEQQRLTTSADQRAVAFASVMIVVLGILIGNTEEPTLGAGKTYVVVGFLTAISLAFYSARPTRIFGSGGDSRTLTGHVGARNEGYLLSAIIKRNDRNIAHNDRVLKNSATVFRVALGTALLSVFVLFADWADLCRNC